MPTTLKQEGGRLGIHLSLLGAAEVSLRHLQLKLEGSGAHLPARPGTHEANSTVTHHRDCDTPTSTGRTNEDSEKPKPEGASDAYH